MHSMFKLAVLTALFAACFVHADVKAPVGNVKPQTLKPQTLKPQIVKPQTVNLKSHEKRINAYHAKMTREGKALSKELLNMHQGMKKGNYIYDQATARKVLQELYAKRMPAAPQYLKKQR